MKALYEWKSSFAEDLCNYIAIKKQTGLKFEAQEWYLRKFDTYFFRNGFAKGELTKEVVSEFIYDKNERPSSHRDKEVVMQGFATYLFDRGYHVYIAEVKTYIPKRKFIPYIMTDDETKRFFTAIDNYPNSYSQARYTYRHTVDPVLFRFLYGTGVRISEALNLVLRDVDTETGVATIHKAKNMKNRLIPMAESLLNRVIFFIKTFHKYSDDETFLFPGCHSGKMGRLDTSTAYTHFRDYLVMADIPHTSVGPRVHSLRHGFAVKCLKNWVLGGDDLTVMVPYLSAYMGHTDFRATQYYLRLTSDLYPDIVRRVESEFGYVIPEGGFIYDKS